jgi:hypothetical protein
MDLVFPDYKLSFLASYVVLCLQPGANIKSQDLFQHELENQNSGAPIHGILALLLQNLQRRVWMSTVLCRISFNFKKVDTFGMWVWKIRNHRSTLRLSFFIQTSKNYTEHARLSPAFERAY